MPLVPVMTGGQAICLWGHQRNKQTALITQQKRRAGSVKGLAKRKHVYIKTFTLLQPGTQQKYT